MLSDEEKKAIEILKKVKDEKPFVFWFAGECYNKTAIFDILLNLIEKQSKEIEELKQDRDEYKEEYIKLQNARYYNYISKDEIKAKIEDILNSENSEAIEKLIEWQSLLEKE